ncbi:MAG: hypothetical protein IJS97_05230 [Prevotella sp.]|nr:hypothetical protein [Prevotella sp.]
MILIRGKEGLIHRTGKDIQNVFQNLFVMRGRWQREGDELLIHYSKDAPRATNKTKQIICMLDGKRKHGGMADRLRGIVSTYYIAKQLGYDFRINFVHPFPLIDYLVPNKVDWRISQEELCYNSEDAEPMFCGSQATHVETWFQKTWIRKRCLKAHKQLHVYTNAHILRLGNQFRNCFNELFRPSDALQKALDEQLALIGSEYDAMTFRFQQLLGDFIEESHFLILSPEEAQKLMERCVEQIEKLHDKLKEKRRFLVTSDSVRFLKYASERLDYVYVVSGSLAHMDWTENIPFESNLKSFLDFYLISKAQRAFLFQTGKMYNSGFPRRAAQMGGVPFKHIRF